MIRPLRLCAVPLLALVLGLAACSSGGAGSASSHGEVAAGGADGDDVAAGGVADQAKAAPPQAAGRAVAAAPAAGGSGATLPDPTVKLVKTADVVIEVQHLDTSAARVRGLAEGAGGAVSSETTSYSEKARTAAPAGGGPPAPTVEPGESVLVLRIPVAQLDVTLEKVVGVGKELWRTSSSVDVTGDLADLGSRVKTAQASVERVRALLARAGSVQEIVSIEAELTRRESDLEALEARQGALAGRAALSTLTVTLRTPDVTSPVIPTDDDGFVGGLKRGWHAVVVSTGVVLTVLGALLPLTVLVAVVGLPVWWTLRRRHARATPPAPPTAAAPPPSPGPAPAPAPVLTSSGGTPPSGR
jgi:Domain of unknown function (DUF4349)